MDSVLVKRLAPLLLLVAACAGGLVKIGFGPKYAGAVPLYIKDNPSLSDGDRIAGRRAFIDAKCIDCHRVAEDPHLPEGPRAVTEPPLANMDRYVPQTLYDHIIDRNTPARA